MIIIIIIVIISIIENPSKNFSFWVYYLNIRMRILYVQGHSEHYAIWHHTASSCFSVRRHFLKKGTASLIIYRYIRTLFDNIA